MPKKENIRTMFDSIAPDYDRLNHILSLDIDKGWRKKAVKEITGRDNCLNILDVACGTGDFAIAIARAAASGSRITGLDLSEGMMKIGRRYSHFSQIGNRPLQLLIRLAMCLLISKMYWIGCALAR